MITLSNAMTLPVSLIKKNFIHNYCRTCHPCQGSSIDDTITIFDHKYAYANRKRLYTTVTRATGLNNVYVDGCDEFKESEKEAEQ